MIVQHIVVGPFQENTYLLGCEDTGKAVLVDPGDEADRILSMVTKSGLEVEKILNTHAHIDHVGAVEAMKRALGVPFLIHETEAPFLEMIPDMAMMFGLKADRDAIPKVDDFLAHDDPIRFGKVTIKALFTPGHSPGHLSFLAESCIIAGDVLFLGSIGRSDLPGGSFHVLMDTIHESFMTLHDAVKVYPGHGPDTTIGHERRTNPFVLGLAG